MKPQIATFFDLAQPQLEAVEAQMLLSFDGHHPSLEDALSHLLSSGGKRIRPTIAILAGKMLDVNMDHLIMHAAAIEMLHTATLVHDDLIDGSLLRRGIPTLNARWSAGATVLTGDYIFARAAHLAAQTGSLALMEAFAQTLMTIVNGEITQLFEVNSSDLVNSYFDRIYAKTASLFEVSTLGVALIGDCDEDTVETMHDFGYNIGLAFQIVDDILDFTGDQESVGKPVGSDLRQGLLTLPTLLYLEQRDDGFNLARSLREQQVDDLELEHHIEAIRMSSAIKRSMKKAEEYIQRGEELLSLMPETPEREALTEIARYVVRRNI
ncbi:MAG: polyprenyl synthetase family protein [Anaerolineales bacterium]|jgi:geranylgeranyl pyrophosphate synthase